MAFLRVWTGKNYVPSTVTWKVSHYLLHSFYFLFKLYILQSPAQYAIMETQLRLTGRSLFLPLSQ